MTEATGDKPGEQPGGEMDPERARRLFGHAVGGSSGAAAGGASAEPMETIAQDFPDFEFLEVIGVGGMGSVYKARQRNLDRIVALKILHDRYSRDPQFTERFAREAQTLAKLSHPNIVALYDFGESKGRLYLVMEYVDGMNLRELIRKRSLASRDVLAIVPSVCDALQYAHELGIVHRDIKPENLLVDTTGRVRIADFGLAKLLKETQPGYTLTGTGTVMGTPHYMAPEQLERPNEVDHRADLYALSVVFYELLTGELPLGRFQPPSQKVHIDIRLDEVVMRSMAREPERRYQHAHEVKSEIDAIQAMSADDPRWSESSNQQGESRKRKLTRNWDEGVIGGLCAGYAHYFGVPAALVRTLVILVIVVFAILKGPVTAAALVLLYFAFCGFVKWDDPVKAQAFAATGRPRLFMILVALSFFMLPAIIATNFLDGIETGYRRAGIEGWSREFQSTFPGRALDSLSEYRSWLRPGNGMIPFAIGVTVVITLLLGTIYSTLCRAKLRNRYEGTVLVLGAGWLLFLIGGTLYPLIRY